MYAAALLGEEIRREEAGVDVCLGRRPLDYVLEAYADRAGEFVVVLRNLIRC